MRAASPLWTRMLGYGGAVVLVAAAVAILVLNLPGGSPAQPLQAGPSGPAGNAPGAVPGAPQGPQAPSSGTGPAGPGGGVRCGPVVASWQRSGDTVKVSVTVPPAGQVAAFVEAKGRVPVSKSVTDTGPHVFEFAGVPEAITRRIGVNVTTGQGIQTCYLTKR